MCSSDVHFQLELLTALGVCPRSLLVSPKFGGTTHCMSVSFFVPSIKISFQDHELIIPPACFCCISCSRFMALNSPSDPWAHLTCWLLCFPCNWSWPRNEVRALLIGQMTNIVIRLAGAAWLPHLALMDNSCGDKGSGERALVSVHVSGGGRVPSGPSTWTLLALTYITNKPLASSWLLPVKSSGAGHTLFSYSEYIFIASNCLASNSATLKPSIIMLSFWQRCWVVWTASSNFSPLIQCLTEDLRPPNKIIIIL